MKAVQSAMAIRRQRHRREEQRRAKARRNSHLSDNYILSPTVSCGSIGSAKKKAIRNQEGFSTVTSLHVGIIFFLMGCMLIISGSVPGYTDRDWENLLGTGAFLLAVGIGLLVINRFTSSKEDEEFSEYISSKMTPAKVTQSVTLTANEANRLVQDEHQLESIIEETPGDVPNQVKLINEVAPVHKSHRHHKSHQVHNHQTSHP